MGKTEPHTGATQRAVTRRQHCTPGRIGVEALQREDVDQIATGAAQSELATYPQVLLPYTALGAYGRSSATCSSRRTRLVRAVFCLWGP